MPVGCHPELQGVAQPGTRRWRPCLVGRCPALGGLFWTASVCVQPCGVHIWPVQLSGENEDCEYQDSKIHKQNVTVSSACIVTSLECCSAALHLLILLRRLRNIPNHDPSTNRSAYSLFGTSCSLNMGATTEGIQNYSPDYMLKAPISLPLH